MGKQRFEYKVVVRNKTSRSTETERSLNNLGEDGWEMCGVYAEGRLVHYHFKRPKLGFDG